MRQAGIVAAAALYALDHHVERIADDHARARRLAEGLAEAGVSVDLEQVETNFVQIDVGPDRADAIARLKEHGVLVSTTVHPTVVRAVTHLDISDDDIDDGDRCHPGGASRRTANCCVLTPAPDQTRPWPYSYCSASSTLSREARRAGKIAAMIPTKIAAIAKTIS